jgi:predicted nucleotidyltransferase
LQDFKHRLAKRCGDDLISMKLFGSRARGDAHPESDIDLLVIFERRTKRLEDLLNEVLCDILDHHGIYFEVVSYGRREYEQSKRQQWPFVLNLEREAVPV